MRHDMKNKIKNITVAEMCAWKNIANWIWRYWPFLVNGIYNMTFAACIITIGDDYDASNKYDDDFPCYTSLSNIAIPMCCWCVFMVMPMQHFKASCKDVPKYECTYRTLYMASLVCLIGNIIMTLAFLLFPVLVDMRDMSDMSMIHACYQEEATFTMIVLVYLIVSAVLCFVYRAYYKYYEEDGEHDKQDDDLEDM